MIRITGLGAAVCDVNRKIFRDSRKGKEEVRDIGYRDRLWDGLFAPAIGAYSQMKILERVMCAVIAVNFALFMLTFVPAFSGIGQQPGLADRLLDNYRVAGWRADIVWVITSSAVLLFFAVTYTASPSARRRVSRGKDCSE
jgi:hypothetical protein